MNTSPEIHFLDIFHDTNDKELIKSMVNELVNLYGFKCILKRWSGIQTVLDPLYQDSPTILDQDSDLYDSILTRVYIDYQRFNSVLHSYGLAMETTTPLQGIMMLEDEPKEDDIIELKSPYDEKYYRFKIGSTDVHKDVCYSVIMNIYHKEKKDA